MLCLTLAFSPGRERRRRRWWAALQRWVGELWACRGGWVCGRSDWLAAWLSAAGLLGSHWAAHWIAQQVLLKGGLLHFPRAKHPPLPCPPRPSLPFPFLPLPATPSLQAYVLKSMRINSDDVRLLYSYPSPWQVSLTRPESPAQASWVQARAQ